MRSFKKVFSGILAAAICGGISAGSISAAGTYKKGDINNDGTVNLNDLAAFQQFANGIKAADGATAERLDVNRDYVINEYDKAILSSIVIGDIAPSIVFSVDTTPLPEQSNRYYYKYNFNTGLFTTYNLEPVSNINSRAIVDTDDRVQENGFNGVLKAGGGTAFVIDTHTILTAAHVIFDKDNNNVVTDFDFEFYDSYNTSLNMSVTPTAYHIPFDYVNDSINGWKYDYAIVTVEEDLSSYVNFDLGILRENAPTSKPIYVTGFGGFVVNANPNLNGVKSTGVGNLVETSTYKFKYTTDTCGGNSGSPAYVINPDGSKSVVGIHVSGFDYSWPDYNSAIRITSDIVHFVYNNDYL